MAQSVCGGRPFSSDHFICYLSTSLIRFWQPAHARPKCDLQRRTPAMAQWCVSATVLCPGTGFFHRQRGLWNPSSGTGWRQPQRKRDWRLVEKETAMENIIFPPLLRLPSRSTSVSCVLQNKNVDANWHGVERLSDSAVCANVLASFGQQTTPKHLLLPCGHFHAWGVFSLELSKACREIKFRSDRAATDTVHSALLGDPALRAAGRRRCSLHCLFANALRGALNRKQCPLGRPKGEEHCRLPTSTRPIAFSRVDRISTIFSTELLTGNLPLTPPSFVSAISAGERQ